MNIVHTNQIAKLSSTDIYNLCCLATDAGIKLPTEFVNAIYTRMFEDPRSLEEMNDEFDACVLFEVLEWQDRMTDQWQ
jgi:hypothetical protein